MCRHLPRTTWQPCSCDKLRRERAQDEESKEAEQRRREDHKWCARAAAGRRIRSNCERLHRAHREPFMRWPCRNLQRRGCVSVRTCLRTRDARRATMRGTPNACPQRRRCRLRPLPYCSGRSRRLRRAHTCSGWDSVVTPGARRLKGRHRRLRRRIGRRIGRRGQRDRRRVGRRRCGVVGARTRCKERRARQQQRQRTCAGSHQAPTHPSWSGPS